ncbi:hypothetical protein [Streptomyces sp. NPDC003395]
MTVLDRIPALKGHGRRRAVDEVDKLRRDLTLALSHKHAAGDELALIKQDLAQARARQAEAEEIVVQQQATIDELRLENHELRTELTALRAAAANAHRVDVPPMVRDTSAIEDQATQPIPLWQAPFATTDPARIPSWAARD